MTAEVIKFKHRPSKKIAYQIARLGFMNDIIKHRDILAKQEYINNFSTFNEELKDIISSYQEKKLILCSRAQQKGTKYAEYKYLLNIIILATKWQKHLLQEASSIMNLACLVGDIVTGQKYESIQSSKIFANKIKENLIDYFIVTLYVPSNIINTICKQIAGSSLSFIKLSIDNNQTKLGIKSGGKENFLEFNEEVIEKIIRHALIKIGKTH